jgi:hypothetical protein
LIVLAALVLGFSVGRWTKPTEPPFAQLEPRATGPAKSTEGGSRRAPEDWHRVRELERELSLERMRSANLAIVAYGQTPTWPEEVPPGHGPDSFPAFVRQAVAECGVDVDIAGFDCDEPPCVVIVRGGSRSWYSDLTNCDVWADMYGTKGASMSGASAKCDDGTEETFTLVGPPNGDYFKEESETDPLIFAKRMKYREEQLKYDYFCQGPGAQP